MVSIPVRWIFDALLVIDLHYLFFTVLTYIDVAAAADGVDNGFAFYLVSIANAASFFGRMGGGLLADKIGKSTRDDSH